MTGNKHSRLSLMIDFTKETRGIVSGEPATRFRTFSRNNRPAPTIVEETTLFNLQRTLIAPFHNNL